MHDNVSHVWLVSGFWFLVSGCWLLVDRGAHRSADGIDWTDDSRVAGGSESEESEIFYLPG
jgi:hypothetical protein